MRKTTKAIVLLIIVAATASIQPLAAQQGPENWTAEQLMEPAALAAMFNDSRAQRMPVIIAVNPDGMYGLPYEGGIKNALWFGAAEKEENLEKLKSYLQGIDRDVDIVLYCGCCPFRMCPNIRPAFGMLSEMGFTNHKLLNLPQNIKENWIDKGYPMKE